MTMTDLRPDAAEVQKKIVNRLKRASGQLNAVIAKVEEGGNCRDVITQLAAVNSALERAGFTIISSAMQECMATGDGPHGESVDDLEKLFLMLT